MLIYSSPQRKNDVQIPSQVIHEEERDSRGICSGLGRPTLYSSNTVNAPSTDSLRITCRNKTMKDLGQQKAPAHLSGLYIKPSDPGRQLLRQFC